MRPPASPHRPAQTDPDPPSPVGLMLGEAMRLIGVSLDDVGQVTGRELAGALEGEVGRQRLAAGDQDE